MRSIVVADVEARKLAGIIPIPLAPNGLHCIFEPKENYLLVVDSAWQYMILFDLSKPNLPKDAPAPEKQ